MGLQGYAPGQARSMAGYQPSKTGKLNTCLTSSDICYLIAWFEGRLHGLFPRFVHA